MTQDSRLSTILVTGGCGFIGTNLVKYLSNKGYRVRILDNLSTPSSIWTHDLHSTPYTLRTQSTELLAGDIRDRQAVERAIERVDDVVHLAAHTSVVESLEKPEEAWDINVNGTLNLLEVCRQKGVNRFIFASSNAVIGEQDPPIDETKIPRPLSPYGASKLAGEALCSTYYHSFGLKTVSLRFSNCYGPFSDHKSGVISKFMEGTKKGEPLVIYGNGHQTRDFVHADDICQAINLSLVIVQSPKPSQKTQSTQETPVWSEVFQIASGVETSINQLAELIKAVSDFQLSVIYKPKRKGEIERNYSDITKARRLLGFEPRIKLREGLEDLWRLYGAKKG